MNDRVTNTISTTCRRLSISRSTFHALVNTGRLRPVKVGRRTLVPEREIWRFLDECQRRSNLSIRTSL